MAKAEAEEKTEKTVKTVPDFCFQPEAEQKLFEWLSHRTTPAFLLVGPPGIGKTTVVHRVLKRIEYTLCEFNASHTRSGIAFRKTILPLLKYGGVQEWLRDGKPDRMAVLLDEMDGLSGGEKGGLQELLGFLKEWRAGDSSHPLVLVCNNLHGRPMEQIRRVCTTMILHPPKPDVIQETLSQSAFGVGTRTWSKTTNSGTVACIGSEIPPEILQCGDLRVLFRYLEGFPALDQQVHIEDTNCTSASLEWAWHCLFGEYDPYITIQLENNEANLAGLVLHENTPYRLQDCPNALEQYKKLFKILYISDWADFWAFFYQCWQILPLTQQLKLKVTNQIFNELGSFSGNAMDADKLTFTRVLSRQSALFNAWKEMCRLHDIHDIPIRCVSMVAGTFAEQKSKNLTLTPVVPVSELIHATTAPTATAPTVPTAPTAPTVPVLTS